MNKLWEITYELNGVEYNDTAEAFNKTEAASLTRQHERGAWIDIIKIEEVK